MDERVMKLLMDKANQRRQELLDHLGSGACKDYAEYREVCGVLRGLLHGNQNIEDLLERVKERDDE
jgi:hypothetical protein